MKRTMLTVCPLMVIFLLLYTIWSLFLHGMCNEQAKNKGIRDLFEALALANRFSPCYNRNVLYVTLNEASVNGTQAEQTRPTYTRAASLRRPPALSPAGGPGAEHRRHFGNGRAFL